MPGYRGMKHQHVLALGNDSVYPISPTLLNLTQSRTQLQTNIAASTICYLASAHLAQKTSCACESRVFPCLAWGSRPSCRTLWCTFVAWQALCQLLDISQSGWSCAIASYSWAATVRFIAVSISCSRRSQVSTASMSLRHVDKQSEAFLWFPSGLCWVKLSIWTNTTDAGTKSKTCHAIS